MIIGKERTGQLGAFQLMDKVIVAIAVTTGGMENRFNFRPHGVKDLDYSAFHPIQKDGSEHDKNTHATSLPTMRRCTDKKVLVI
jgi:hypothetical protein